LKIKPAIHGQVTGKIMEELIMIRKQNTIRVFAFLALVIILVGCSGPTAVVAPTPDIPSIRTEAVQTVVAKLTIEAALNPSPTAAAPATEVPEPTATEIPSPTEAPTAAQPTATALPTLRPTTVTSGGGSAQPTATRRAGPDQANLTNQEPKDGTVYNPGNEFDGAWTFKNVGTSTWNTSYYIRAAENKGTNIAKAERYYLSQEVKPGESIRVVADMVAPGTAGRYVSYWELVNDNGAIFYQFYVVVDVK
jgi:hypothetical protein